MKKVLFLEKVFIGLLATAVLAACIPFEGSIDEVREKAGAGKAVKIEITSPPAKLSYNIGDELDLSGLVVTAFYKNNTSKAVTGYTCSGFDSAAAGSKTITVSFEGQTAHFTVTVEPPGKALTAINISSQPSQTDYAIGESLDLSGLAVTALYSDGSTEIITDYTHSGFDSFTAGSKTITISFEGKTAQFTVMVNPPGKTLTTIAIITSPAKTTYNIGEDLNTSNLVVRVYYSDSSENVIPINELVFTGFDSGTGGSKEVAISYGGKTTSFMVTVNARTFTVTFDRNGGDTEAVPASMTVTEALPAPVLGSLPVEPTRVSYTFAGWNTQADGSGEAFTETTTVAGSITVYAQWKGVPSTVTFDKNTTSEDSTEADPLSVTIVFPVTTIDSLPTPPERKTYTFKGWNTQADGSGAVFTETTTVTDSITVYAQWAVEMVNVEGGTFELGNYNDGTKVTNAHMVTLSGFMIGKYQVTQEQWQEVMTGNSSGISAAPSYFKSAVEGESGTPGRLPVECVSWYDVVEFCNILSVKEGLSEYYNINKTTGSDPNNTNSTDPYKWLVTVNPTANGYRLPTEAQWEYAAKGGSQTQNYIYSGSNTANNVIWYNDNSSGRTHQVGLKQANELGIYDMSGNEYEWCWDWSGDYTSGAKIDPIGAAMGSRRVLRGGSCNQDLDYSTPSPFCSARRDGSYPSYSNYYGNDFGFRLCLPLE